MHNVSVTCFGTGDGSACADRGHSSFLYRWPGAVVLLDCGEPVSGRFKASGADCDVVDRIVLSHMHFDHTGGFFMLIQGFWLEGRKRDLHVHLPEHGIEPVRRLLQSACLFPELLPFGLHFHALRPEECITQGEVKITPVATAHLDGFRRRFAASYPDCYDAFAFVMENERCRVGHSADVGSVDDLEPLLAKPLSLLVVEVSHFRPQDLFARLAAADVGEIVFTHLGRPHWEDLQGTQALAAQALGGRSYRFARDEETLKI